MMFSKLLHKVFGSPHDRKVKSLRPVVAEIRKFREQIAALDDIQLVEKSAELRARVANGQTLEDIKVEAFAVCQEACDRRLGMFSVFDAKNNFDFSQLGPQIAADCAAARADLEAGKPFWQVLLPGRFYTKMRELYPESVRPYRMLPFDVQLIGGLVLHEGAIAEMATGEGKTLAAACPVYLNALSGKGVHVITVNDYLASRDAANMGRAYAFLGLSVGVILHDLDNDERRKSYGSDVTYGTNNEFGFDYLRDNMATENDEVVQRELNFCIVDEVDSILIDEARTPLIISGPAEDSTDKYQGANSVTIHLKRDVDYTYDEKTKNIQLTDPGVMNVERLLGINNLYGEHAEWVHFIMQSLRSQVAFHKDVDYIVKDDEVIIVDENTGRLMDGRRYSEGLHQALEAKEGVAIRRENQTLATITFQNLFRMYKKLSGMTGTAETEATEFEKIYNMHVWTIPTHKPCVRLDADDRVYRTEELKWKSIVAEIKARHEKGQPVLVGTVSVEKSERLAKMLVREGVPHEMLNAKNHGREAEIIQFAGHAGRVTISTNMAGRGTDIGLGPGVIEVGGLFVLGTERHESRRIDNQLRGRAGRQGDPGESRYFLSLDDDLLRIFGGPQMRARMERFGYKDDEAIEAGLLTRAIRTAQKRIEGQNFESRKHLLDYDNVMNEQRKVVYGLRRAILFGADVREEIVNRLEDSVDIKVSQYVFPDSFADTWDLNGLTTELRRCFEIEYAPTVDSLQGKTPVHVLDEVLALCKERYEALERMIPDVEFRALERRVLLYTIDQHWRDHLLSMDYLREAIRFHGYAQKDPLLVYKKEGFDLFQKCMESIANFTAMSMLHIKIEMGAQQQQAVAPTPQVKKPRQMIENTQEIKANTEAAAAAPAPARNLPGAAPQPRKPQAVKVPQKHQGPKLGRNDVCWCGSGKKYKKCHGENED